MDEEQLKFVPSRVTGFDGVTAVTVFPDRIELHAVERNMTVYFAKIAEWGRPVLLRRLMHRLRLSSHRPAVGERDWFHEPSDRYFVFYTDPRLTLYMPLDEPATEYALTHFVRIKSLIARGRYSTMDLG